jgi:hypothetical protein
MTSLFTPSIPLATQLGPVKQYVAITAGPADLTDSIPATGEIIFTTNPVATNTLTVNGSVITFVASGATGLEVNIGATLAATLASLLTLLQGEDDTELVKFAYMLAPDNATLQFIAVAGGTGGNALTLATTVSGASVRAMAGGTTETFTARALIAQNPGLATLMEPDTGRVRANVPLVAGVNPIGARRVIAWGGSGYLIAVK